MQKRPHRSLLCALTALACSGIEAPDGYPPDIGYGGATLSTGARGGAAAHGGSCTSTCARGGTTNSLGGTTSSLGGRSTAAAGESGSAGGAPSAATNGGRTAIGGTGSTGGKGGTLSNGGDAAAGGATATNGGKSAAANGGTASNGGGGATAVQATSGGAAATGGAVAAAGENSAGADAAGTGGSGGVVSPPFFSEYVEGSGSYKALEVVADAPFDIAGCQIEIYPNGASKRSRIIAFGASAASGAPSAVDAVVSREAPLVICSPELATLISTCALSETLPFTGNDTILLSCGGVVVDAFGRLLEDPGANGWGTAPRRTADITLRRSCATVRGDADPTDVFDPALEWEEAALDAFDDLGLYCAR